MSESLFDALGDQNNEKKVTKSDIQNVNCETLLRSGVTDIPYEFGENKRKHLGYQNKFLYLPTNKVYKEDKENHESVAEVLCTIFNNAIIDNIPFVKYEQAIWNFDDDPLIRYGCKSNNFKREGYSEITIYDYLMLVFKTDTYSFEEMVDAMNKTVKHDTTDFFRTLFTIDAIVQNDDRNLSNIVLLLKRNSIKADLAPIFDFGKSFEPTATPKAFAPSYNKLNNYIKFKKLKIDINKLNNDIESHKVLFDREYYDKCVSRLRRSLITNSGTLIEEVYI